MLGAFAASTSTALPSTVRSILGSRHQQYASETHSYTAADYVQDGLIVLYDGIENAGLGVHDFESPIWADLSENGFDVTMDFNNCEWLSNGVQCYGTGRVGARLNCRNEYTQKGFVMSPHMEVVISSTATAGSWIWLFSLPFYGRYQCFSGYSNRYLGINGLKRNVIVSTSGHPISFSCSRRKMTQDGIDLGDIVSSTNLTGLYNDITIGGSSQTNGYRYGGKIFCIRSYTRELTDEEMAWNLEIDRVRFNAGRPS